MIVSNQLLWASTVAICFIFFGAGIAAGQELQSYEIVDERLSLQLLDTSKDESFLSVTADSEGQVFVGGREVLLVYRPDGEGGLLPPVELYRFTKDSWVYDIAVRGDDLYVSTVTTLYVIPGGRKQQQDLKAKPLLWGMPVGSYPEPTYGVHQGMHGLAWGPEGDLYISFGDPLWYYGDFDRPDHWGHWYFYLADGSKQSYNGVGGVARLRHDGSHFQVFATGLRNPCGIAFDNQWVLFSHDNDHEQRPDLYVPGRLLHVAEGNDFCWPRGWMVTKSPERKDLLHTMFDGMRRTVPVGQSYYGEKRLPKEYFDTILLARWGQRSLTSYPKWPEGASYRGNEETLLKCSGDARPVGVCVGPQGRIFAAVCYMSHNEKSPIYRSDLVVLDAAKGPALDARTLVDVTAAADVQLRTALDNPNWQVRQAAHLELLRRGGSDLAEAVEHSCSVDFANASPELVAHAVRLIGTDSSEKAVSTLKQLSLHPRDNVRLHAVEALAGCSTDSVSEALFVERLSDKSAPVQLAAIEGLHNYEGIPQAIITGPACSADTYLRQAAVRLMEAKLTASELASLLGSTNDRVRLGAVLALGRQLTIPKIDFVPPQDLPLAKTVGPKVYLDRELIDLRELDRIGNYTTVEYWNFQRDALDTQFQALLRVLNDPSAAVRVHAAYFLSLLNDEQAESRVRQTRENAFDDRLAKLEPTPITAAWLCGPFDDVADESRQHGPELGPTDLGRSFTRNGTTIGWARLEQAEGNFGGLLDLANGPSSYYASFQVQSAAKQRAWLILESSGVGTVWHNGRSIWNEQLASSQKSTVDRIALELHAGTNTLLIRVKRPPNTGVLALGLSCLEKTFISTPDAADAPMSDRLKNAGTGNSDIKPFLEVDWRKAVTSGDVEQGKKLFKSIGCVKCHAISNDVPVSGGPSLADAGRRFTVDYLVESVLLPSNKVSEFFKNTIIVTSSGKSLSGVITSETAREINLLQANGERIKVSKEEIEVRKESDLSPMPSGLVKTVKELQHLVAYLIADDAAETP